MKRLFNFKKQRDQSSSSLSSGSSAALNSSSSSSGSSTSLQGSSSGTVGVTVSSTTVAQTGGSGETRSSSASTVTTPGSGGAGVNGGGSSGGGGAGGARSGGTSSSKGTNGKEEHKRSGHHQNGAVSISCSPKWSSIQSSSRKRSSSPPQPAVVPGHSLLLSGSTASLAASSALNGSTSSSSGLPGPPVLTSTSAAAAATSPSRDLPSGQSSSSVGNHSSAVSAGSSSLGCPGSGSGPGGASDSTSATANNMTTDGVLLSSASSTHGAERCGAPPFLSGDVDSLSRMRFAASGDREGSKGAVGVAATASNSALQAPVVTASDPSNSAPPGNPFADLPNLLDVPANERHELFRKKLQACAVVYDFTSQTHQKEKEQKRQTLLEVVEYINNSRNVFTEQIMQDLVDMVASNIFRSLPPASGHSSAAQTIGAFDPEEDDPVLESAWPHLQMVYECFLRFVVSNDIDPKAAKKYIDQQLVLKLLELFQSEDPRERDYLKTILHRVYGKIMALRFFIRKAIQNVFFKFIYECEVHNGISELLEILGSIINGFALPLKEEHKIFLERSLIPLHKARSLNAFHQQLTYCMTQYVEKDSRLAEPIILGMLRFWPVTNTPKEVLFLNELEDILELTQPPEFQRIMEPLAKRMSQCIQSPHFQVAERVLFLWNNDYIVNLINNNKQQLFPVVIAALYKNSKDHWNSTVHGLTYNVSKLLAEADPALFDDCSDKNMASEERMKQVQAQRKGHWQALERIYEQKRCPAGTDDEDSDGEGGSGRSSPEAGQTREGGASNLFASGSTSPPPGIVSRHSSKRKSAGTSALPSGADGAASIASDSVGSGSERPYAANGAAGSSSPSNATEVFGGGMEPLTTTTMLISKSAKHHSSSSAGGTAATSAGTGGTSSAATKTKSRTSSKSGHGHRRQG